MKQQTSHLRNEPLLPETALLQNPPRSPVVGTGEGLHQRQRQHIISDAQGSRHQFRGVTPAPDIGMKGIADLRPPARIKGIFVEPAPADDPAIVPVDDRPGRATIPPTPSLVQRNPPPAAAQTFIEMGMAHGLRVAEEGKQRRYIGEKRWTEQKTGGFDFHNYYCPSHHRLCKAGSVRLRSLPAPQDSPRL